MLQVMIRVKNAIRKKVSDIKKIWKRKVVVLYCNTSSLRILDMLLRTTVAPEDKLRRSAIMCCLYKEKDKEL